MVKVVNGGKKISKRFRTDGTQSKDLKNQNINMETIYFFKKSTNIGILYKNDFKARCLADYIFVDKKCIKSRHDDPSNTIFEDVFKKFNGIIIKKKTKKKFCNCHCFKKQVCDICQGTTNKALKDKKL